MSKLPSLNLIGLKESGGKHYLPHYYTVPELYPNTRITHVESKSVMHTQEGLKALDFWGMDADVFLTDDAIGYTNMLNTGGNHFDYFSGMLKMYQINHGLFEQDTFTSDKWTKNKGHVANIYTNMVVADAVWISPVLRYILGRTLPQFLSKPLIQSIRGKLMTLPPPGYYKLEGEPAPKPRSLKNGLVFLWNHRFTASKRPKVFFGAIEELHKNWPDVPIKILICSLSPEQEAMTFVPESIKDKVVYSPFLSDKVEYEEFIRPANITMGTSEIESFGISVLDCIRLGINYVNLVGNEAFTFLAGTTQTTVVAKGLAKRLHDLYTSRAVAIENHEHNLQALSGLPDHSQAKKIIRSKITEIFAAKIATATGDRSAKIKTVLHTLDSKALSKRQLYETMGWPTPKTCRNAFWPEYYYALRKQGVQTKMVGGEVFFYTDPDTLPKAGEKSATVAKRKSLF